jgi:hypothetical protein
LQAAPPPGSISLTNIQNIMSIIDVATQRGAFRANELSQVGQEFDVLVRLVQSLTPPQQDVVDSLPQPGAPLPEASTISPPPFSPKMGG